MIDVLSSLQCLEGLELNFPDRLHSAKRLELDLGRITNLRTLKVSFSTSPYHHLGSIPDSILDGIFKAIANNKALKSLHFTGLPTDGPGVHLPDLLSRTTVDYPIPLEHLHLHSSRLIINGLTLPHLMSVTSLTARDKSSRVPDIPWEVLRQCGVRLRRLATNDFSRQLLEYLLSYDGLECLSIQFEGPPASDEDSEYLYKTVLPHHAQTLVELEIHSANTSGLYFNPLDPNLLAVCPGISKYGTTLSCNDLENDFGALVSGICYWLRVLILTLFKIQYVTLPRKTHISELVFDIGLLYRGVYYGNEDNKIVDTIESWSVTNPWHYPSRIVFEWRIFVLVPNTRSTSTTQKAFSYCQMPR